MRTSSMPHCCPGVTWPARSPSRPESTAPGLLGQNARGFTEQVHFRAERCGLALREAGATSTTDRGRNSLAWTTTPKRGPLCSCPARRGVRSAWMSPRSTQALHNGCYFEHLLTVSLVCLERGNLLGDRLPSLQPCATSLPRLRSACLSVISPPLTSALWQPGARPYASRRRNRSERGVVRGGTARR